MHPDSTIDPASITGRVKDMWSRPLQQAVFVAALCEWLTSGALITMTETASQLGSTSGGFI